MLCEALVAAVGLDKDRDPTSLGPGSSQARESCRKNEHVTFFDIFSKIFDRFFPEKSPN